MTRMNDITRTWTQLTAVLVSTHNNSARERKERERGKEREKEREKEDSSSANIPTPFLLYDGGEDGKLHLQGYFLAGKKKKWRKKISFSQEKVSQPCGFTATSLVFFFCICHEDALGTS